MKKVLIVATVIEHINSFHLPYIKQLSNDGFLVDVVSNGGVENVYVNQSFSIPFSRNPLSLNNFKAYRAAKCIIENGNYDVIYCHTPIASALVRIAAKNQSSKVIYTAHGFHFYKGASIINKVVFYNIEKHCAKYTDVLITMNDEDFESSINFKLKENGKHIKMNGIGFSPRPVIRQRNEIRTELSIPEDAIVLTCVAEFSKGKNHRMLIELMKRFKSQEVYLVLCGRGRTLDDIKAMVKECELSNKVIFAGYRNDITDILNASDIFVFPSMREGLPVAVMEAMQERLPVVGNKVRGVRDLIDERKGGILVCPRSKSIEEDYYNELLELIHSSSLRKEYGDYNHNKVQKYEINTVLPEYIELLEEGLDE